MTKVSVAPPRSSQPPRRGFHWRYLIAAPHRIFFFGGAWAMVFSIVWWGAVLLARAEGLPHPPVALVPQWMHSWLMVLGSFIFFVFGFGMTALPRWLGMGPLPKKLYVSVALGLMLAYILVFIGGLFSLPLTVIGMIIAGIAWFCGVFALARLWFKSPANSKIHPMWAILAMAMGGFIIIAEIYGLSAHNLSPLALAPRLGVWAFLGPIIFAIFHRIGPFFAQAALGMDYTLNRPAWSPLWVIPLLWAHAALLILGQPAWVFVVDLPLTLILGYHLIIWQPLKTRKIPLLWSLFVAFAWFPVATLLSSIQSLALLIDGRHILGLAPLHAMAIGLATSMVFAMATRVSMGHSGRPLRMEHFAIVCFVLLQLAVLCRICAELPLPFGDRSIQLVASSMFWLLAFIPWALRMSILYWQPRADGRPG